MKVQRIQLSNNRVSWVILDDDFRLIEPLCSYLRYLESLERSPNTIHTYATHLKFYWEYLQTVNLDWHQITLEHLADFIAWLRRPDPRVISLVPQPSSRTERTINGILSAVCNFYEFQERLGNADTIGTYRFQFQPGKKYKAFLHHINKGKETQVRLLKLKEPKKLPETLTTGQVKLIVDACTRLRDKFLVCLLNETGMRIGQALGLRHEDIHTWDNEIQIVPRTDNANGSRSKTHENYTVHVSRELMDLYSTYLINEYPSDIDSDYVFVNLRGNQVGAPMTYITVANFFKRLSQKVSFKVHPHLFRHTHATELIRSGWDMAYVQKRLGHQSIQTTINTYTHLTNQDLKQAFQSFICKTKGNPMSFAQADWSSQKHQGLKNQLLGFWAEDVWDLQNCPLKPAKTTLKDRRFLKFQCASEFVNTELKYVIWQKLKRQEWTIGPALLARFNLLMRWAKREIPPLAQTFLTKELHEWEMSFCSFLLDAGFNLKKTGKYLNGSQVVTEYAYANDSITFLRAIYRELLQIYDQRYEYEKEIWDLRLLNRHYRE